MILPVPILNVLERYRKSCSSRWMFPSPKKADSPLDPAAVRKKLAAVLKRAGCKHLRFHDLRHTFATTCLQAGCDVKTLSELLGHANANITLQRYVHSDLTRKRREMNRIFSHQVSMRGRKALNLLE